MLDSFRNQVFQKSKEFKSKIDDLAINSDLKTKLSTSDYFSRFSTSGDKLQHNQSDVKIEGEEIKKSRTIGEIQNISHVEGGEYFVLCQQERKMMQENHKSLLLKGDELTTRLVATRKQITEQIYSEQYINQQFHTITELQENISSIREIVDGIVISLDEVEEILTTKSEEYIASHNAVFASQQQHLLEKYELERKEASISRQREIAEARRSALATAFENDLETYQSLISYQGEIAPAAASQRERSSSSHITLENIDLNVDEKELENFYGNEDDDRDSQIEETSVKEENDKVLQDSSKQNCVDTDI